MSGHVWTRLLSLMLSCDVWISPVEGALPYAEAPSTLHHCCLQHLLPTCAEYKFHFQTLRRVVFFSVGPPPPPLIALIVYTVLYYDQAVGREGEVREHHLVSECNRDKVPLDFSPSICLFHAPYSPSNWQWWVICFRCPFLFTSVPNALCLLGVIIVFFFRDEKKEGVATQKWFMSHNDLRGKSVLTWKMLKCFMLDSLAGS